MLVLSLDSATQECAVGVGVWPDDGTGAATVLGETNVAVPRAALTHLVPMISRLLDECGHGVGELGAVVVGRGPGSFTGVRIGVSTAKGIAQGLGVPLWGVSTADAVAERLAGRDGLVGVVGDAMRKEVYPALFECGTGVIERLEADAVGKPEDVAARWASETTGRIALVGEGLAKYAQAFADALGDRAEILPEALWRPTGSSLLQAAWRVGAPSQGGSPALVLPVYTRLSDAEEAEAARQGDAPVPPTGVAGPGEGR